jgi:methionine-rich copper-binding protein CopC
MENDPMRIWTAALAATTLAVSFGAADAHPRLLVSNPAANAKVGSVAAVRLGFSETLVSRFCHITLAGPSGQAVKLGAIAISADRKQLSAPVQEKLAPGAYKLSWQAVSTDTHRVTGAFAFTVTP